MNHIIKKYTNRKLYDTVRRRYTTVAEIGEMVRSGEESVQILEDSTGKDITAAIMAQVIAQGEKGEKRQFSIDSLKSFIREKEGSIRELAEKYAPKVSDSLKSLVEEGRKATDKGRRILKDEAAELRKDFDGLKKSFAEKYVERAFQAVYKHGPTRREVLDLTTKIDALNRKLDSLNGGRRKAGARTSRRARKATA